MEECRWCSHFFPRTDDRKSDGQCKLMPEWRPVKFEHFCGQLSNGHAPAKENARWKYQKDQWQEHTRQRERAIKAEKALKEARARIRQLAKP